MPQPPPVAHVRRTARRPARPPDDRPLGHVWRRRALGWALVVSLGLLGGAGAPAAAQAAHTDQAAYAGQSAQLAADAAQLEAAVAASLAPSSSRGGPRVSLDPSGDATVTFAIRATDDDPSAIRAGALSDTLAVLRTVYAAPAASHVRTLMVLGTFPFQGTKSRSVRESPVLRAVLSAERAAQLAWSELSPDRLPDVLDAWWLQGAFASVEAQPPPPSPATDEDAATPAASEATPTEPAPAAPTEPAPLAAAPAAADALAVRVAVARAHLDESRLALDRGQVGIGRSQFKQFFDVWDELDESIAERYPGPYAAVDADLERAELALLHRQPEDLPGARAALQLLAADLASLADQLAPP